MANIYEHVEGSPYQPGELVIITGAIDTFTYPEDPKTCEPVSYLGLHGEVKHLEYECGCGQTYPEDPMIGVLLETGEEQEFWQGELTHSE